MGLSPRLVPGSAQNFKITYAPDFAVAQAILEARVAEAINGVNTPGNKDYDYP